MTLCFALIIMHMYIQVADSKKTSYEHEQLRTSQKNPKEAERSLSQGGAYIIHNPDSQSVVIHNYVQPVKGGVENVVHAGVKTARSVQTVRT